MEVSELSSCRERMGSSWKCSGKCWKDTSCAEISASFLGGNEGLRPWSAETSWKGVKGSGVELDTQSFFKGGRRMDQTVGEVKRCTKGSDPFDQWTAEISPCLQWCRSHITKLNFLAPNICFPICSMFLNIHRNCQHSPGLLPTPKILGMKVAK